MFCHVSFIRRFNYLWLFTHAPDYVANGGNFHLFQLIFKWTKIIFFYCVISPNTELIYYSKMWHDVIYAKRISVWQTNRFYCSFSVTSLRWVCIIRWWNVLQNHCMKYYRLHRNEIATGGIIFASQLIFSLLLCNISTIIRINCTF